jgi:hypothetical protein
MAQRLNGQEEYHGTVVEPTELRSLVSRNPAAGRRFRQGGLRTAGTSPKSEVAILHSMTAGGPFSGKSTIMTTIRGRVGQLLPASASVSQSMMIQATDPLTGTSL